MEESVADRAGRLTGGAASAPADAGRGAAATCLLAAPARTSSAADHRRADLRDGLSIIDEALHVADRYCTV
jgi:hypothetical protein